MPPGTKPFDEGRRLHIAAREGDVERIERFLEAGEDVNKTNGDGDTPLHLAVWKQSKPAIRLLVLNGASTMKHDARGKSPLEKAKQWGGEELGVFLEEVLEDYRILQSDLRIHMLIGDWNEFNKSLEYRCLINISLPEGQTLLHMAAQLGSADDIRELSKRGADIQAQDKDGRTALHIAVQSGSAEAIRELHDYGANNQAKDKDGLTAFNMVAQSGSEDTMKQLLDLWADIELDDNKGRSPLHDAARTGPQDAIDRPLDHGAHDKATDKDGRTHLHDAARAGSEHTKKQSRDIWIDIDLDRDLGLGLDDARAGSQDTIDRLLESQKTPALTHKVSLAATSNRLQSITPSGIRTESSDTAYYHGIRGGLGLLASTISRHAWPQNPIDAGYTSKKHFFPVGNYAIAEKWETMILPQIIPEIHVVAGCQSTACALILRQNLGTILSSCY